MCLPVLGLGYIYISTYLSIYLSHSLGDRWGTTRPGNQHSSFLCSPHGVAQFQTRPIPDAIFPSLSLSASPSPSPYTALEDCLGKSRSSCDMPIPLHFASFYSGNRPRIYRLNTHHCTLSINHEQRGQVTHCRYGSRHSPFSGLSVCAIMLDEHCSTNYSTLN